MTLSLARAKLAPSNRMGNLLTHLPYWDLSEGVVFLEDGRMEVALEIFPPAPLFAVGAALEASWVSLKSVLQLGVPSKERARVIVESLPADGSLLERFMSVPPCEIGLLNDLASAQARMLERERQSGTLLEWRLFVTCTVAPTERRTKGLAFSPRELAEAITRAHRVRERLKNLLETAGYAPKTLHDQEVFNLIWRYLNPSLVPAEPPGFLGFGERTGYLPDAMLAGSDVQTPTFKRQVANSLMDNNDPSRLIVGDRYVAAVSFQNLPHHTEPGMIQALMRRAAGGAFTLVIDYAHQPLGPKMRSLAEQSRKLYAASEAKDMPPNPQAMVAAREVNEVIEAISSSGDHVYKTSITAILISRSPEGLESMKESVVSAFSAFPGSLPVYGAYQHLFSYLACAPMNGRVGEFQFDALESSAADLMPPFCPWRGSRDNPVMLFRNRWSSLTAFDPFDPLTANWNGAVIAGPGSGKTFLMQKLITSLKRHDCDVFIVDQKRDYAPLMEQLNRADSGRLGPSGESSSTSATISFGVDGSTVFNIFDLAHGEVGPDETKKAFLKAALREMIPPSPDPVQAATESAILDEALAQGYAMYPGGGEVLSSGGDEAPRGGGSAAPRGGSVLTLSDFHSVLSTMESLGTKQMDKAQRTIASSLAVRLTEWTGETVYGRVLDGRTNVDLEASTIYFECSGLEHFPSLSSLVMLIISDAIWRRAKQNPGRKKLAILEEFWAMLKTHEARDLAERLYRLGRTYNLGVYAVSQKIGDLTGVAGLLQSSSYLFLGRLEADEAALKAVLDLPDGAIAAFKSLTGRKGVYAEWLCWVKREDRRVGDVLIVTASPEEYWTFTSDPNDKARRDAMTRRTGSLRAAIAALASEGTT